MNALPDIENTVQRLKQSSEAKITVTGRRTGKKFSAPVWFVLEGEEKVVLVPMRGSENDWFKDLEKDPHIELSADGLVIPLKAMLVRDSKEVEKILDRFRSKYKTMWSESYYTKRDVYVEVLYETYARSETGPFL